MSYCLRTSFVYQNATPPALLTTRDALLDWVTVVANNARVRKLSGSQVLGPDPVTNHTFTAITNQQGQYKFEGLPAGAYSLVISAPGFSDARREEVKVTEETVDVKLEIAPVEASVTVSGPKAEL